MGFCFNSGSADPAAAVTNWVSEDQFYHFNNNAGDECDVNKTCGHYTQVSPLYKNIFVVLWLAPCKGACVPMISQTMPAGIVMFLVGPPKSDML